MSERFGIIYDEPASDYHASDGVSSHRLADFSRPNVPLLYYRKYISKEAPDTAETEAKAFGEYFHCLALEGEPVADTRFSILPKDAPDRPTKAMLNAAKPSETSLARQQWWAAWDKANAGKTIISGDDYGLAWQMVKSIREKPKTRALFDFGKPEVVCRFQMASFAVRSRLDWFDERLDEWQRPLIVDVKTIDKLANFEKQFFKYGYYRQAAFYQLVVYETMKLQGAHPRVKFVVVEKNEPYQCAVYIPGETSLDIGRKETLADLKRLKECYDTDIWPGTADEELPVEVPDWKQLKGAAV